MTTTHSSKTHEGIRAILNPRSIAFIGASDDVAKWGGVLLHVLRKVYQTSISGMNICVKHLNVHLKVAYQ